MGYIPKSIIALLAIAFASTTVSAACYNKARKVIPCSRAKVAKPAPVIPINHAGWITGEDYPFRALRMDQSGRVAYRITINGDGFPIRCDIVKSSGYGSLDGDTCSLLLKRARFEPNRGGAVFESTVNWELPPGPDAGCIKHTYQYARPTSKIIATNVCKVDLLANICGRMGDDIGTYTQGQLVPGGGEYKFEFFNPTKKSFRYNLNTCRQGRALRRDICLPECPPDEKKIERSPTTQPAIATMSPRQNIPPASKAPATSSTNKTGSRVSTAAGAGKQMCTETILKIPEPDFPMVWVRNTCSYPIKVKWCTIPTAALLAAQRANGWQPEEDDCRIRNMEYTSGVAGVLQPGGEHPMVHARVWGAYGNGYLYDACANASYEAGKCIPDPQSRWRAMGSPPTSEALDGKH